MTNYPKELTDLVEEYLTDGVLTTKERQVLINKAVKLNVDPEEFDLYLDAQQQKIDQVADAAVRKAKGKTCPFCGSSVPQLADKCPECGQFITPEASEELQEIFKHLEDALVDFKSGNDVERNKAVVERYVRKANMYYGNNPKVKVLLSQIQAESEKAEKDKKKAAAINIVTSLFKGKWAALKIETLIFTIVISYTLVMHQYYNFMYEYYIGKQQDLCLNKGVIEWWDAKKEDLGDDYIKYKELQSKDRVCYRKKDKFFDSFEVELILCGIVLIPTGVVALWRESRDSF